MKVKHFFYVTLLRLLRLLGTVSKSFVRMYHLTDHARMLCVRTYRATMGFWLYKIKFYGKKRLGAFSVFRKYSPLDLIGDRTTLQIGVLLFFASIVTSQTRWYQPGYTDVPGHTTILYHLIGPGEQDFSTVDNIVIDGPLTRNATQSWQGTAVYSQPKRETPVVSPEDIIAVGNGGLAFVKPLVLRPAPTTLKPSTGDSNVESVVPGTITKYVVKAGDSLASIARRFGLSVATITSVNNLTSRSLVHPGDTLQILPVDGIVHTVARRDTISKIALLYGAKTEDIARYNNGTRLVVGQKLVVPFGKIVKKAPIQSRPTVSQTSGNNLNIDETPDLVDIPPASRQISTDGYIWPSGATIITQYYGLKHTGVDIAGRIGLPNYAAKAGTVVKAQCGWNGGYGCYIIIDHGNGVQSLYGHNSKLLVSAGEYVEQGQTIGLLGSTGRSTGPHLHFEIRLNGRRTNPLQFIRR